MTENYFKSLWLMDRVNTIFLSVIKKELGIRNIRDISNVQALLLYSIGEEKMRVADLKDRNIYLCSNPSYGLKNMVKNDYLIIEENFQDQRSVLVSLSKKGFQLYRVVEEILGSHVHKLKDNLDDWKIEMLNLNLELMEKSLRNF